MENVKDIDTNSLLSDQRVVEEINRHLWIESEKAGYDIGFDKAREDWLKNFSKAWMQYNIPESLTAPKKKAALLDASIEKPKAAKEKAAPKKRRAKSYL